MVMSNTNRRYASARMKRNNPMMHAEIRERMGLTLRAIGHGPKVRGGNGRPPSIPQQMLADALAWPTEYVVKTSVGYLPNHYKLDIANPRLMVAIEVDGVSHSSPTRRQQDYRKAMFLSGLGWTVLRFSNRAILDSLETVLSMVASTISRLPEHTPTLRMAS